LIGPDADHHAASAAAGAAATLQTGARTLTFERTRIMGVLNLTPDSFSDGGRFLSGSRIDLVRVRAEAEAMLRAGADILDIGGESTRPGAAAVGEADELGRVMPVLNSLLELDTMVSVDTRKAGVAKAALAAGCHLINDVSGLTDEKMLEAVAESDAAVCIMHMQGEPQDMQANPSYTDVVAEVRGFLEEQVELARAAGIADSRLCLDPGFGFGKTLDHNLALLRSLGELRVDGLPLLVGLSRKRMIGALTGTEVDARMPASVAAAVLAAERGANIVRVHDVAETAQALKILEALRDD
jgi:dihydropteroate synthase